MHAAFWRGLPRVLRIDDAYDMFCMLCPILPMTVMIFAVGTSAPWLQCCDWHTFSARKPPFPTVFSSDFPVFSPRTLPNMHVISAETGSWTMDSSNTHVTEDQAQNEQQSQDPSSSIMPQKFRGVSLTVRGKLAFVAACILNLS